MSSGHRTLLSRTYSSPRVKQSVRRSTPTRSKFDHLMFDLDSCDRSSSMPDQWTDVNGQDPSKTRICSLSEKLTSTSPVYGINMTKNPSSGYCLEYSQNKKLPTYERVNLDSLRPKKL
ncbi:hypothetical protein J6590_087799 [Homalodisca vitripennis]|nr:hypothetical protein J6590_087799 [Homalodisca vitripennis]